MIVNNISTDSSAPMSDEGLGLKIFSKREGVECVVIQYATHIRMVIESYSKHVEYFAFIPVSILEQNC